MTAAGDQDPHDPRTQRPEFQVSDRQYHRHMADVKAARAETALPITIVDTCSLISILVGQHNHHPPVGGKRPNALPRGADGKDSLFLLDWLSDSTAKPPRTLIIPHEVLRELLQLQTLKDGAPLKNAAAQTAGFIAPVVDGLGRTTSPLDINFAPEHQEGNDPKHRGFEYAFKHSEGKLLAEYLMRVDRKPKIGGKDHQLRLYASVDDMIKAGEIEKPKGGIIIVDSGTTFDAGKFNADGIYGAYRRDAQIGDTAIIGITNAIEKSLGKRHYPVLTHDGGLVSHFTSFDGKAANPNYPFAMTPRAFIKGLHNTGQIDRSMETLLFKELDRTTHKSSFADIRQNDPRWTNSRRSDQTRAFHHWEDSIMEGKAAVVAAGGTWGDAERERAATRSTDNGTGNGVT